MGVNFTNLCAKVLALSALRRIKPDHLLRGNWSRGDYKYVTNRNQISVEYDTLANFSQTGRGHHSLTTTLVINKALLIWTCILNIGGYVKYGQQGAKRGVDKH